MVNPSQLKIIRQRRRYHSLGYFVLAATSSRGVLHCPVRRWRIELLDRSPVAENEISIPTPANTASDQNIKSVRGSEIIRVHKVKLSHF
jgi:hypothetical protein